MSCSLDNKRVTTTIEIEPIKLSTNKKQKRTYTCDVGTADLARTVFFNVSRVAFNSRFNSCKYSEYSVTSNYNVTVNKH